MTSYAYTAINARGLEVEGVIAANDLTSAREQLQKRVSARRFGPDAAPALRSVRDDLLRLLRESMVKMARNE